MNQTKFEDTCSKCGQPCTRVKRISSRTGSARFVTSCCEAKPVASPLAVPVVKE
jgi:hypothetical protein